MCNIPFSHPPRGHSFLNENSLNQFFQRKLHKAKADMIDRQVKVTAVIESLEFDMELLCLTGVEDRLQENVKPTLEMLTYAGIKVVMMSLYLLFVET